jgi:hypothetical protein
MCLSRELLVVIRAALIRALHPLPWRQWPFFSFSDLWRDETGNGTAVTAVQTVMGWVRFDLAIWPTFHSYIDVFQLVYHGFNVLFLFPPFLILQQDKTHGWTSAIILGFCRISEQNEFVLCFVPKEIQNQYEVCLKGNYFNLDTSLYRIITKINGFSDISCEDLILPQVSIPLRFNHYRSCYKIENQWSGQGQN